MPARSSLEKLLPIGEQRYVSGTAEFYDGMLQMVHPDRVVDEAGFANLPLVEPVYPLTEGLALGNVRRAVDGALRKTARDCRSGRTKPGFHANTCRLSAPRCARCIARPNPQDVRPEGPAWTRLAYDELLAGQLALSLVRSRDAPPAGSRKRREGLLRAKILAALPYSLTPSQQRAVDDITTDLALPQRMLRLLQGDVGSGKTVVALIAASAAIEAGRQAALMAPTEILARQHYATIAPLAKAADLRSAILTGRERGKEREDILGPAGKRRHRSSSRHPRAVPG